jgi:hypothetical protein
MRNKSLCLLALAALLCGCRTRYDITLNNGDVIAASTKPRLVGSFYVFKDANGRQGQVSSFRVQQIERKAAGAKRYDPFNPTPGRK